MSLFYHCLYIVIIVIIIITIILIIIVTIVTIIVTIALIKVVSIFLLLQRFYSGIILGSCSRCLCNFVFYLTCLL